MKQKPQLSFLKKLFLYCTSPEARKRVHAKSKLREKAYRARVKFLRTQYDEDFHIIDADPEILGSSAWLIDHQMTSAFDDEKSSPHIDFDHELFDSSQFDYGISSGSSLSAFNDSNAFSDWVTGGTDSTGCHGMGGHHDGWSDNSSSVDSSSTDSFNSHDPFA